MYDVDQMWALLKFWMGDDGLLEILFSVRAALFPSYIDGLCAAKNWKRDDAGYKKNCIGGKEKEKQKKKLLAIKSI